MRVQNEGLESLRDELRTVDPQTEARIGANDTYRVVRALEVYHLSGKPLSSFKVPNTLRPGVDPLVIGMWRERAELYDRIDRRVRRMFTDGLTDEVVRLIEDGIGPEEPGFQSIGYREFVEVGGKPPWPVETLEAIESRIARNSRRYAKRQELFFRRLPNVTWIHAERWEEIFRRVRDFIACADDSG